MKAEITLDKREIRGLRLWTRNMCPGREVTDTEETYYALLDTHFKNHGWTVVGQGVYEHEASPDILSETEKELHADAKFRLYCGGFLVTFDDGTKSDRRMAYDKFVKSMTPEGEWKKLLTTGKDGQWIPNGQLYGGFTNTVRNFFGFEHYMWDYTEDEIRKLSWDTVYDLAEKLCRQVMLDDGVDPDVLEAEDPDAFDEYMHNINTEAGRDGDWFEKAAEEAYHEARAEIAISHARFEEKIPEPVTYRGKYDDEKAKQWIKEAKEEWDKLPEPTKGRD